MKGAVKKVRRWKKIIAWMLTAAIVAGNVSELSVTTAYASELVKSGLHSSKGKATPSEATPSEAGKEVKQIDVKVTESAIKKALKKDFDDRLELNEDLIPFEGEQKEMVLQKLYEQLGDQTLVLQKKSGKAMYMVVISSAMDGDPFFDSDSSDRIKQESLLQNIQIIAVNGYEDRECEFRMQITGDDMTVTDAQVEEYVVVGQNSTDEEELEKPDAAEAPSPEKAPSGGNGGGGGGSSAGSSKENGEVEDVSPDNETEKNKSEGSEADKKDEAGDSEDSGTSSNDSDKNDNGNSSDDNSGSDKSDSGDSSDDDSGSDKSDSGDSADDNSGSDKSDSGDSADDNSGSDKSDSGDSADDNSGSDKSDSGDSSDDDSGSDKSDSGNNDSNDDSGSNDSDSGNSGDDSNDGDSQDISWNRSASEVLALVRHEVPVLFEGEPTAETSSETETKEDPEDGLSAASPSEAANTQNTEGESTETQPSEPVNLEDYDEPEVVSTGNDRSLEEEELAALMGVSPEELNGESRSRRLFSIKEKPYYSLRVSSLGISVLTTEVNGEEKQPTPYETALTYYGENAVDPQAVVEFDLSQSKTGEIQAGEGFSYKLTYTMQAAPLYDYTANGKLSLFDTYENARIEFTVPDGIILEEQEGKVELLSGGVGESKIYQITVGEDGAIRPGTSDNVVVKAYIDGNGKRPVNEAFGLEENCAAFYAEVKVADKSDKNNIEYPGNIETVTYAEQSGDTTLTLVSPDEWHIDKKVYPSDGHYTVINGESGKPEFVEIQYLVQVGMYGNSGNISTDPNGTVYQRYGRTGFEEDSYKVTDYLEIITEGAPEGMKPVSVTAAWSDGTKLSYDDKRTDGLTITEYKTQGGNSEGGHVPVAEETPTYSSYLITARYPYEPFVLNYNDSRIHDKNVFTIKNTADLEYVKLGTGEKKEDHSDASVAVHEVNKPAVIKIKKMIDEATGSEKKYDKAMEKKYPGLSGFKIYSLHGEEKTEYTNYTVIDSSGKKIDSKEIIINPTNDSSEAQKNLYTTGDGGFIEIQVDPGTYVIEEISQPEGTKYQSGRIGNSVFKEDQNLTVTVNADPGSGETAEVTVVNDVVGMGAIKFTKKARSWKTSEKAASELGILTGAVFGLYKKNSDGTFVEIKQALSDEKGEVLFKPVTPGDYVVKEISASGYIVDTQKEYPVTVIKDQTAQLTDENIVVNELNEAKVTVTKKVQKNDGTYDIVQKDYRNDFQNKFWFQQSTDQGNTWQDVKVEGEVVKYSLDSNSTFTGTLKVYDSNNQKIQYRVAEELPDGYSNGNEGDSGVTAEEKGGKNYVYKTFELQTLKTTQVEVKNKKEGTLKLKKLVWELTDTGTLNKDVIGKGYQFKLYTLEDGVYKEVREGKIYETNDQGMIEVKGLDITKEYFWCEVSESGTRLEAEDGSSLTEFLDGVERNLIGPYKVSREGDLEVKAYNVPQKVPYWIYKVDAVDESKDISAQFQITDGDGTQLYPIYPYFQVTKEGRYLTLDPGKTYTIHEISASYGYELAPDIEIKTPEAPVTRKKLEAWIKNTEESHITIKNKPWQQVTIKKGEINESGGRSEAVWRAFEVYTKEGAEFISANKTISSSGPAQLPSGTYYFKEVIKDNILNPYYLLNKDGEPGKYEIKDKEVYFGPFTVKAASSKEEQNQNIYLLKDGETFINYKDYGRVTVIKTDALRTTDKKVVGVSGAKLGIYRADQFNPENWAANVPIQTKVTGGDGKATFDDTNLKIFDEDGNRITYLIAEITPPKGYLQSYETITTTLKEGKVITTKDGIEKGELLEIKNEPKLTIRTQKLWKDSWNNQFYPVDHVLGNVELALYKVKEGGETAVLVTTTKTNSYDGIGIFYEINRNDTYYVVETEAPEGLNMGGRQPLPRPDGSLIQEVSVEDLENTYNAVSFTAKELGANEKNLVLDTKPLMNYKDWVQFNIVKTCNGIAADGSPEEERHRINGAKFALYKQLGDEGSNLSGITVDALSDGTRFEKIDTYESGTRLNPEDGTRIDGEFDTTILENGRVYWLVEEEPASGSWAEGTGPQIAAVFVPKDSAYSYQEGKLHEYVSGRNEEIATIENPHSQGGEGYGAYQFQIALNKWLKDLEKPDQELSPLGGVKYQIWLIHPKTKEKLLPIQVVETGLESDQKTITGFALSEFINFGKLEEELKKTYTEDQIKEILRIDESKEELMADFALEEIFAPSKVTIDPQLHYLTATVKKDQDNIDWTYFWKSGDTDEHRLINTVSKEYPVKFVKYGYEPGEETFEKTDDELDALNMKRTPLAGVKLFVQEKRWTGSKYEWKPMDDLEGTDGINGVTDSDGIHQIKDGLKAGYYRVREELPADLEKEYILMYKGWNSGLWRYFSVGSTPVTVNIYNPEKPDLEIEKQTWNGGNTDSLEGITFSLKKSNGKIFTSSPVKKGEDGRFTAAFENLENGTYSLIQESLSPEAKETVTGNYFADQVTSVKISVGYEPKASGERVYLKRINKDVTGKVQKVTIRNPRLSGLTIKKTNENSESGPEMAGARFTVEYQKFRDKEDIDAETGLLKSEVTSTDYAKPISEFEPVARTLEDNQDGTYSMNSCEPGWYKITEIKAPEGYTVAGEPLVIAVTGDMTGTYKETTETNFVNKKKAELTVTKKLNFGDFKDDAAIKEKLPEEIVFNIYTWENGSYKQVLDEEMEPVQVKIRNFEARDGYYTAAGTVSLPQDPAGGYYYLKEEAQNDWTFPLENAVNGGTLQQDGYIQISSFFDSQSPVEITAENIYAKAKVRLTKLDETSREALTGAVFELYSDAELTNLAGKFSEIGTTGVYEAEISTKDHQAGTYYIKEVNAPTGYIPVTTAIPAEGFVVETGKTALVEAVNKGGIDLQLKKYSGNGNGDEVTKDGIQFELYINSGAGTWSYAAEGTTDANGELSFRGLELPAGASYGVYEVPEFENGLKTSAMASFTDQNGKTLYPSVVEAEKAGEAIHGLELYVLTGNDTKTPGVYEFEAHNQEALPLKLVKNDINKSENPKGISATMKITDKATNNQVGDLISVPYGEEGVTVKLLPGTYEIEETSITQNDQGYIINKDDLRTVYKKEVTIEKGKVPEPCEFTNVKQNTGLTLDKTTSAAALKDLWWNDGQTITYTLTPNAVNTIPLDGFVLTDTGLEMLDSGNSVLPAAEYTDEKYTITEIMPGIASQQNQIKDAKTGTIIADITFYDFEGNQAGPVQSVAVSGDQAINPVIPAGGKNVKSFSISYHDDTLKKSSANHYALGQNFVPGSVMVTVKLHQQDSILTDGSYKKEIKSIRNKAFVTMNYRKWDVSGGLAEEKADSKAEARCDVTVEQSKAPTIAVNKSVNETGSVKVGSTLTYTLSVKNITESDDASIASYKQPILVDNIPLGVTVSGVTEGESHLLKAVKLTHAPEGVTIEKTVKKVDANTGQETIFIQLSGELKKGEYAAVELEASVAGNIINYDKNILNKLYVTSDVQQPAFSLNETGASFMVSSSSGPQWPSADLPESVLLPDEKYKDYGYASSSAQNHMNTGTGLLLYKEVKGNLDTRYVSGNTVGKVAKSASDGDIENKYDGTVSYRLTVNNASASDYVTDLQLMDIMPVPGDYSTGNIERLSDFRLQYKGIESIAIVNVKENESGRKLSGFKYDISYSESAFKDRDTTEEAKNSMKNNNEDGFWSDSSNDPTAIRIQINDPEFYLAPGENLVVTYETVVPYETMKELNKVAYSYAVNDFATYYSYKNSLEAETATPFLQIQTSNTVQVLLVPGNVKVSGRIWIDDNDNGIQDESIPKDHLLTDLYPVLNSGYFNVTLAKQSKYEPEEVVGTVGLEDARFLFDELMPAKPAGVEGEDFTSAQENSWYDSNGKLIISKLKGEDPSHYQIYVKSSTMPDGFEDLILKLARPTMLENGSKNEEPGRSRLPKSLQSGNANYGESLDSNFNGANGAYASEDFFLWSTSEFDTTKDIGFVPFRNVTVKKANDAGNPVVNAHFSVYGPFTNEQIRSWQAGEITDISVLGNSIKSGYTALEGNEAVWNAGELLYYRNYIIAEDEAPAGYKVSDAESTDMIPMESFKVSGQRAWVLQSKEFKSDENAVPSKVTVKDRYISGSLEFTKTDEVTGSGLRGASFRISQKSDVVKDAWRAFTDAMEANADTMGITKVKVTDDAVEFEVASETGKVTLTGIPYGTYSLSEITVPDGYDISKKPENVEFKIETDGQQVQLQGFEGNVIKNTRTEYSLSLKKVDNTGNDVADIEFSITGPGRYENSSWIPFSKAKFKLNDPALSGFDKKLTDSKGLIQWNLPYGDYEIKETQKAGYEPIEPFYIRVSEGGSVSLLNADERSELTFNSAEQNQINVTVTNTIKTGPLSIEKVDGETREKITGAVFELSGSSVVEGAFARYLEQVTGLGVTDVTTGSQTGTYWIRFRMDGSSADGNALLTGIPYGSYTLKEVEAPEGYLLTNENQWQKEITIDSPEGVRLTGENAVENIPHELVIEKRDKMTSEPLMGAVFKLKTADGSYVKLDSKNFYTGLVASREEASEFATGADGRVTIKRLPAGNYVLEEISAPANYEVTADTQLSVLHSGNSEPVVVYDKRNKAKIRLTKVAEHDHSNTLSGAVFDIYSDQELSILKGTMTTGDGGIAESEMLPLGTYYVKEKTAPAGYELSQKVYEVTLKADSESYAVMEDGNEFVTNEYGTGSMAFEKRDSLSGEILSLAQFKLVKGTTEIPGAWETYTGIMADMGAEELEAMGIADVKADGNEILFTVVNGQAAMEGIPFGTYTLKEVIAPKGYLSLVDKDGFTFTISADKKEADLGEGNVILNDRAEFEMQLKKVDDLGRAMSGISFEITGPGKYQQNGFLAGLTGNKLRTDSGSYEGTYTTGDDGLIHLGLKNGDYQIKELSTDWYDAVEPFFIRIDEGGNVSVLEDQSSAVQILTGSLVTLSVTNKISTGSLELEKVDSENKKEQLTGAQFTLTNVSTLVPGAWDGYRSLAAANGASWSSEDVAGNTITFVLDGKGVITNLPYGTYRLTETKAPDGYILGAQAWSREFTIDSARKEVSFTTDTLFNKTEGAIENSPSQITVKKTNAVYADLKLAGAEFILKTENNQYVTLSDGYFAGYVNEEAEAGRFVTDGEGEFVIKKLPAGTYHLIETKAPEGYQINDQIPPITLDGVHSFTVTVQDEKIAGGSSGGGGGGGSDFTKRPGRDSEGGPGTRPDDLVTILPDEVPLANLPADPTSDMLLVLDDGDVPLARLPKTGDKKTSAGKMMVAVSGIMLALYAALSKKKKQN